MEKKVQYRVFTIVQRSIFSIKTVKILFAGTLFFGIVCRPVFGLTLDEAREIALRNNPALKAAIKAKESAHWDAKKSIWGVLPSAQASGSYSLYDPAVSSVVPGEEKKSASSVSVSVIQPVYNGRQGIIGIRTSRENEKIADYTLEQKMLETIADTETKYFSVLENKSLMTIASKDLEASFENSKTAGIRYRFGTLSRADFLNIQSQASSKEVTYIQAKSNYDVSRRDFANFLRIAPDFKLEEVDFSAIDSVIEVVRGLDDQAMEKIVQSAVSIGMTSNPSLKISAASVKISKNTLSIARQAFFPSINLSFTNSWDKSDLDRTCTYQGVITLSGSIPLFPVIDTVDEMRGASSNLQEVQFDYESSEDGVALSIQSAVYALVTAARSIGSSRQAMEYAESTYEQMKVRFESGIISSTDLLDAEVLLSSAERQYTTSRYNFLRAESSLMKLMGLYDKKRLHELFVQAQEEE